MIASHTLVRRSRLAAAATSAAAVCGLSLALVVTGGAAQAAATDVPLATTAQFAVLAGSGITNTGPTTISGAGPTPTTGDLGTFPTTSITGAGSITTTGVIRGGDSVVQGAKPDLITAYDAAAGALPPAALSADVGGATLKAGVHRQAGALQLTGTVTLDGEGDASSVFIIQVGSDFTTATTSSVALVNGAQACHVYWQIAGSATFGTSTSFKGTVLALTSITANTSATFQGRLLARNGAVTLDTNTITLPACAPVTTTPPPTTATTSPAPVATTTPAPGAVKATARPTRSPSSGTGSGSGGGSGSDEDSSGSGGSGSGSGGSSGSGDGDGSGSATDGGADADGSSTTTSIPDTGGPSALLAPAGLAAVVAGTGLVLATRRRRGAHRA